MTPCIALIFVAVLSVAAPAFEVVSWNVESGGADPAIIAGQLDKLPNADAYLLQEVSAGDIGRYAAAIRRSQGKGFKYYLGSLGGADRLAIIFDESKYRVRSFSELFGFEKYTLSDWNHRPPLVAHLQRKSDGCEFLLVTVHLARGNASLRSQQAEGLCEWAAAQDIPVVLAGDCNFDFDFITGKGNAAYDAFFANGVWKLAEPEEWIDTNWADRDGDGRDDYPDSCLDFAAVCPHDRPLVTRCKVIVREGDFPDTQATSDHRPLFLTIEGLK